MCGRYSLLLSADNLANRFNVTVPESYQPRYNAAPGQSLPVITDEEPGAVRQQEWGLIPPWADSTDEGGYINARGETLEEKPSFRDAFRQESTGTLQVGRCLVPADSFYEWTDLDGTTQPFRVTLTEERPFAMAGLWAQYQPETTQTDLGAFTGGGETDNADVIESFTIVTTTPNEVVEQLHHRMAVVLDPADEKRWLQEPVSEVADLLGPYPSTAMDVYPVSTAVNDPANDAPAVVEPIEIDHEVGSL